MLEPGGAKAWILLLAFSLLLFLILACAVVAALVSLAAALMTPPRLRS